MQQTWRGVVDYCIHRNYRNGVRSFYLFNHFVLVCFAHPGAITPNIYVGAIALIPGAEIELNQFVLAFLTHPGAITMMITVHQLR